MRRKRGFTLIEVTLAIVVGVVVLGAVISSFQQYRNQARINQGKLNMASIKQAMAMYRYRRGVACPLGYRGSGTPSGPSVTFLSPPLLNNSGLNPATPVCVDGVPFTIVATAANSITFSATPPTGNLRAGLLGNADDQCSKLVQVPDPNPAVDGMGLSDPWLGYTNVRPSTAANLPHYEPGKGFQYDATRYADGNEVWGGLVYFSTSGDVEYVLPAPDLTPNPPANLGRFPGDPPMNWGE